MGVAKNNKKLIQVQSGFQNLNQKELRNRNKKDEKNR